MIEIKVCASSANLGPGFDTLGLGLSLYNIYKVEASDELIIEGCPDEFKNENNLFYIGYQTVCKALNVQDKCHVIFDCNIPISRGLGSSANLISAGAIAANYLHGNILSRDEIFRICVEIEGHPDNVAPCIYGGLTSSFVENHPRALSLEISPDLHFTAIIPDYTISTKQCRKALPKTVSLTDAVYNISHVIALCHALKNGDRELLRSACHDSLHQPYRKKLIKDYEFLQDVCFENQACAFMISGSGPTCLVISHFSNFSEAIQDEISSTYRILDLSIAQEGFTIKEL
ncbi:MAG: homoserine kinase [Erysipelotrichaceae bacterium]|nr:homoserine kinase [Erysipelotrichaceae bacterium]MDY5251470.1 homoserine kinase [Erysipelotrichaceae bacterium]